MKKYITVAALLAAGTAFAGAEEWAVTNSTQTTASNYWGNGFKFILNGDRLTVSGDEALATEVYLSSVTVNIRSYIDSQRPGTDGNSEAVSLVLCDSEYNIVAVSQNSISANGDQTWTFSDAVVSTSGVNYIYYIDSKYTDDATAAIGKNITSEDPNSTSNTDDSWLVCAGAATLMNYDGTGTDSNSLMFMGSNLTKSYTAANSATKFAPKVSFVLTSIPEPSAFGMLAGLGALALVASRRRRK